MAFDSFLIAFDGDEADDIFTDLVNLEVELCDEMPSSFRLVLGISQQEDGTWKYLDEERFRAWTPVSVSAGFVETGQEELFAGYVTQVTPKFDPDEARCTLEISGMDASVLMDREEKLKDWPDKKDSDIASDIFDLYELASDVEDTTIVHDAALSTVIQRETDLQFLRRLAVRNGFACYVEGTTASFRSLPVDEEPQPVLAAHFGDETNLTSFTATIDALRPAKVSMFQVDRFKKEVLSAAAETAESDPLGSLDADALLTSAVEAARVFVAKNAATGAPEMDALCKGLFEEGSWFVVGEGEIDAGAYGHVLRPRGLVTIKGVGETYSGEYYVSYVRHTFTCESYTQAFRVQRDALLPTGSENFSTNGSLGGLL